MKKVRKSKLVIENNKNNDDKIKYNKSIKLVIVESPSKCSKIESFLGDGYKVIASFGHLTELKSLNDMGTDFNPVYQIIEDIRKKKNIEVMREYIKNVDEVILATDNDREGEAIAWHICNLFGLPVDTTKRIIFNEITQDAIQNAIKNPKTINISLVNSQKVRQMLDLMVGFTVSPLLWKYIAKNSENSLSAGRCQTPALKLVYDRHMEILKSPGLKVYNITGYFTSKNLPFVLNKQFKDQEECLSFLEESVNHSHIFNRSDPIKILKHPSLPFITSSIQQHCSNVMRISPKETMKICQLLYEEGYITYMRTDNPKYSIEFIKDVKNYINSTYSNELYISLSNLHLNEGQTAAHEAIRPTNVSCKYISDKFSLKEKKMYNIIWENSIESCMSPSEYMSITSTITAPFDMKYIYISELNHFLGWEIIKSTKTKTSDLPFIQSLSLTHEINYKRILANITFINTKPHYSEAKLISLMEDTGIGRPSTFASIENKLIDRGYVKKQDIVGNKIECLDYILEDDTITEDMVMREIGNEKSKLVITPTGIIVMEFLENNFSSIFNYEYTKLMELELDKISMGDVNWVSLCFNCSQELSILCDKLKDDANIKKHEIKIDETHSYMIGKYGPVIKHTILNDKGKEVVEFKSVNGDIELHKLENGEYKLDEIISPTLQTNKHMGEYEGQELILKKGRYGLYASWGKNTKSLASLGNRPIENIKYMDIISLLEKVEQKPLYFTKKNWKKK